MQLINKAIQNANKLTSKHLVISGVFILALAGSIGLGLSSRTITSAATQRDCDTNSIDHANYGGGCGAADAKELVADARHNVPGDLQAIYSRFGLTPANYDKFAAEAKQGTLHRDGRIVVGGQTVATGGWSMGREKFNAQREAFKIGDKTYYHSATANSYASGVESLPVMVWFNADGTVKTAIINACGNPVSKFTSAKPEVACKALNAVRPDAKKPNVYRLTTTATLGTNTKLSRVVYSFSDGRASITKTSLTDAVDVTLTKDTTVTATVYATVPGGKEVQAAAIANCAKALKYTPPVTPPVTPPTKPMCTVPGKENLPPNHPDCGYCKPGIPTGDARCNPPQVLGETETLPVTGPTQSLLGLATGVGMAGFAGHKLYLRRKFGR